MIRHDWCVSNLCVADLCSFADSCRVNSNLPLRQSFGLRVRQLREAAGLSQEAFADVCGYARSYMSRVERGHGNPSLDAIEVFAAALKVSPQILFEAPPAASTSSMRLANKQGVQGNA